MSEKNDEYADINSKFMNLSNPIWAAMEEDIDTV
jgi:hypothetical protein